MVHLCYAGMSGSTTAALSIAAGSAAPSRHAYILYGACELRPDYGKTLDTLGCEWHYVHKPPGPSLRAYRRVAQAIAETSAGALLLHGQRALPLAMLLGTLAPAVPRVAVHHGSRLLASWAGRRVCIRFAKRANLSIAVSQSMAENMRTHPRVVAACNPLEVIPNGIDTAYWAADPPDRPVAGPCRLLMMATLTADKDHRTLLRALGYLRRRGRDVVCEMIGAGPQRVRLQRYAQRLGLGRTVRFVGDVTQDTVRRLLHEADICCHATLRESFGLSVAEAMAASRPIAATDVPGVAELIDHDRTGLLTPLGDARAMAGAIGRLMDEPDLASRLGAAARADAAERCTQQRMAEHYERVIDDLLAQRSQA